MTKNCSNPKEVFGSFIDFLACFQEQGVRDGPPNYSGWGHNENSSNYWFADYKLDANSTFGRVIGSCISQYCVNPDPGLEGCKDLGSSAWGNLYRTPEGFSAPGCRSLKTDLDQDFMGPGMSVAYSMQLVIMIYVWFVIRGSSWMLQYIKRRKSRNHDKGQRSNVEERLSHHASVTKSVLVEFQEAQSFFAICVQAALLIAFLGDADILQATNYPQLKAHYDVAIAITLESMTSLVLGLWILHRSKLDSIYIFAWSLTSVLLNSISLFSIRKRQSGADLDRIIRHRYPSLDRCGGFPPPLIYCSDQIIGSPDSNINPVGSGCLVIFGILVFQKVYTSMLHFDKFRRQFARLARHIESCVDSKLISRFSTAWMILAEFTLLAYSGYMVFILFFTRLLDPSFSSNTSTSRAINQWTFGQILSVTIWTPITIKYLYWTIFGTDAYSDTRLPEPFYIGQDKIKSMDPSQSDEKEDMSLSQDTKGVAGLHSDCPVVE